MAVLQRPTGTSDDIYSGRRPVRAGDIVIESQGMAPIPEDERYGASWRNFTVWFAPNMELSGVFTGTIAFSLGLGFLPGIAAIVLGIVIGALPVALLATWGPKTGMGQMPLARLPFGKTIVLPAVVQWVTSIAWDALVGLFGAQAAQILFHIPFVVGVVGVLALEGLVGFLGYEVIHQLQKWGSGVLVLLFAVLTVRILQHGDIPTESTIHGAAAVGAFVLMTTVAIGGSFSWATYAADYSRYQDARTSPRAVFGWTLAGLSLSFTWTYAIGLAAARLLVDQTAGGVQTLVGGGVVGILALVAVLFGAVTSNAMNDYSGSLAVQAAGVRVRRNWSALLGTALAFVLIIWLNDGNLSAKFQNILLFSAYWIAPFLAVVLIDWRLRRGRVSRGELVSTLDFHTLPMRWAAAVALVAGFAAMVPFMNTGILEGPVAQFLQGADIAFYVGFAVAAVVYAVLRRRHKPRSRVMMMPGVE